MRGMYVMSYYHTITFASPDQAQFIAGMPQLVANGHRVGVDGSTVTISDAALAVLAEQPFDVDGHYETAGTSGSAGPSTR
jgi:hypothetical protein